MKFIKALAISVLVMTGSACAQTSLANKDAQERPVRPDIAAQIEAMQRVDFLTGKWEGEGWVMNGPNRFEFRQTENVRYNLDGGILLIDGRGYNRDAAPDAKPYFSAFAIVSYDDKQGEYEFSSYAYGHKGAYKAELLDDGGFQWAVGSARYRIWLNTDGQWFETGERKNTDGEWTQFFEMTLTKTE